MTFAHLDLRSIAKLLAAHSLDQLDTLAQRAAWLLYLAWIVDSEGTTRTPARKELLAHLAIYLVSEQGNKHYSWLPPGTIRIGREALTDSELHSAFPTAETLVERVEFLLSEAERLDERDNAAARLRTRQVDSMELIHYFPAFETNLGPVSQPVFRAGQFSRDFELYDVHVLPNPPAVLRLRAMRLDQVPAFPVDEGGDAESTIPLAPLPEPNGATYRAQLTFEQLCRFSHDYAELHGEELKGKLRPGLVYLMSSQDQDIRQGCVDESGAWSDAPQQWRWHWVYEDIWGGWEGYNLPERGDPFTIKWQSCSGSVLTVRVDNGKYEAACIPAEGSSCGFMHLLHNRNVTFSRSPDHSRSVEQDCEPDWGSNPNLDRTSSGC